MDVKLRVALGIAVVLASMGCGGARHRKVSGPPPEYELPEPIDASASSSLLPSPPRDAGVQ